MSNTQDFNNDDLFEHHHFVASKGQEPLRVDKFLMNFIENASRNKIQKAAKSGNIFVNNETVKPNHKVKAGDEVKVLMAYPPYENLLEPENIPIDIVYEDDELCCCQQNCRYGCSSWTWQLFRNFNQCLGLSF